MDDVGPFIGAAAGTFLVFIGVGIVVLKIVSELRRRRRSEKYETDAFAD